MPSSCPVCEQPIASTAAHCSVCGFPAALAIEGLRAVESMAAEGPPATAKAVPTEAGAAHPPAPSPPPSREEELTATISEDLRARMEALRELGRGPDVTSELCQAALSEAEGRAAEALEILRAAQSRLEEDTDTILGQRLQSLEGRRTALQLSGARFALDAELRGVKEAVDSRDRGEAVARLVEAERRVTQLESDWKGLLGLLAQIESLRNEAAELAIPLGEISSELDGIRDRLQDSPLTEDLLDGYAQEAAQVLMLLHEAIPSSLEEELRRAGTTLDRFPEDDSSSAVARRAHLEATRHLKKGRLSEAIQSVRELRRQLVELERVPAAPAVAAPVSVGEESEDQMLDRLLKKARSLAARVRTLPADSETSREAAAQIREATELLRARRLKEADQTLTFLMRMLATEPRRA